MGRNIVTKETQEGCLSFEIISFLNFLKVKKLASACRKDFFDKLRPPARMSVPGAVMFTERGQAVAAGAAGVFLFLAVAFCRTRITARMAMPMRSVIRRLSMSSRAPAMEMIRSTQFIRPNR